MCSVEYCSPRLAADCPEHALRTEALMPPDLDYSYLLTTASIPAGTVCWGCSCKGGQ